MTTKEQERKALEKIKEIIAGLGERSYVGMAFEGCCELAEDNIGNDFGRSAMDEAKRFKAQLDKATKQREELRAQVQRLESRVKEQESTISEHVELASRLNGIIKKATEDNASLEGRFEQAEAQIAVKDAEIIKLKAKLYDALLGD